MSGSEQRKSVAATSVVSCDNIWPDDKSTLLSPLLTHPNIATHFSIGVLFLLAHQRGHWRIAALYVLRQSEKMRGLRKLTAFAGIGRTLRSDGFAPVVTVNGSLGYAYDSYASYTFAGSKL